MLYAAAAVLALLFAALAYVARRGLHPAIEGLAAGAVIAIVTKVLIPRNVFAIGRDSVWNGIVVAAALIAEYALARAVVRRVWQ